MLKPMNQSTRLVSPRIDHTDALVRRFRRGRDHERTSGAHEIERGTSSGITNTRRRIQGRDEDDPFPQTDAQCAGRSVFFQRPANCQGLSVPRRRPRIAGVAAPSALAKTRSGRGQVQQLARVPRRRAASPRSRAIIGTGLERLGERLCVLVLHRRRSRVPDRLVPAHRQPPPRPPRPSAPAASRSALSAEARRTRPGHPLARRASIRPPLHCRGNPRYPK